MNTRIIGIDVPQGISVWDLHGPVVALEEPDLKAMRDLIHANVNDLSVVVVEAPYGRKTLTDNKDAIIKNAIAYGRITEMVVALRAQILEVRANEWRATLGLNGHRDAAKEAAEALSDHMRRHIDADLIRGPRGGSMTHAREADCMALYGAVASGSTSSVLWRIYTEFRRRGNPKQRLAVLAAGGEDAGE